MIKIGILPTHNVNLKRPFLDTFYFVSNYVNKIYENGATPLGIFFSDEKFSENILSFYDGFLLPGGSDIKLYHILTVHYAVINNKPLLGICMGMQVIGIYSMIIQNLENNNLKINYKNISKVFMQTKEDDYLVKIDNHNKQNVFYFDSIFKSSHNILLYNNSLLRKIYKNSFINASSIHDYALKNVGKNFIISGLSDDGCIETIEYADCNYFIIGVQFHPELEYKHNILFKYFIKEAKKRKN